MEEKVLTADELLKSQQGNAQGIPSFAAKLTDPSRAWEETQNLEQRIHGLKSAIIPTRVSLRSQLTEAVWDIARGLAKVTKPCGKHWDVMGHIVDNSLHLYPEEALFLLETNAIEVKFNDIAMSIQQSYEVMLAQDCSLDEYRVYSHLSRQGYKVVRHQGALDVTVYEDNAKLEGRRKEKRKKASLQSKDVEEIIPEKAQKVVEEVNLESIESTTVHVDPNSTEQVEEIIPVKAQKVVEEVILESTESTAVHAVSNVENRNSTEQVEEITLESDDDDIEIINSAELNRAKALNMIPNLYKKTEVTLETPKTELLPYRVWPKKQNYKVKVCQADESNVANVENDVESDTLSISVNDSGERHVQHINNGSLKQNRRFYNPITNTKGKKSKGQKVKNSQSFSQPWKGYFPNPNELIIPDLPEGPNERTSEDTVSRVPNEVAAVIPEVITLSDDEGDSRPSDILVEGPLRVLWSVGKSVPLLKPSQAKSTKSILSTITLNTATDVGHSRRFKGTPFKISFDVYGSNVHFKKSAPTFPNFRLVITKCDANFPTEHDLNATMAGISDKVPIVFGIVSQSDVVFFSLSPVTLPTDITMG